MSLDHAGASGDGGQASPRPTSQFKQWLIKLSTAALGAASVVALGVYDNLKGGFVQSTADWVRYQWSKPVYILALSEPVEIDADKLMLTPTGGNGIAATIDKVSLPTNAVRDGRSRYIEITIYPGQYYIQLQRKTAAGSQILASQVINLGKPGEPVKVDTSSAQWATVEALTVSPTGGRTKGTRWTLATSDSEALSSTDGRAKVVLRAALSQLGVWEKGDAGDAKAIAAFWDAAAGATPSPSTDSTIYGLWGGAFVAWAVAQGGATPPRGSAAFRSWENWGTAIAPDKAKPGLIAIVETGNRQAPTPSGLMVGIFLRTQPDCTEMVTGNLADRVAITCVQGRVLSYRSAGD